jgi:hypothetical protein
MTFDQCAPGRRVIHCGLGEGIIDRITDDGLVEVIYHGRDGGNIYGSYDRQWFGIYPDALVPAAHSSASDR